jgi:hypothetical protein
LRPGPFCRPVPSTSTASRPPFSSKGLPSPRSSEGLDLMLKEHAEVRVTALDSLLPGGQARGPTLSRGQLEQAMRATVTSGTNAFRWVPNPRPTSAEQVCVAAAVTNAGTVQRLWMGSLTVTVTP